MPKNPRAEQQKQTIVGLLQADRVDELRRRLDAGELDPTLVPEIIWNVAGHPAVDLLDRWHDAGVDPNWASMPRPLALAVSRGRLPNVESLIAAGADPNVEAALGGGPLHKAVFGGHDAVAACLLDAGADPTLHPGTEELIVLAVGRGMIETVRALLDLGVDVDTRGDYQPAFQDEHSERRCELMKRAIDTELSPEEKAELEELKARNMERLESLGNPPPYQDATLLAIAHGEGHEAVAELLIEHGADPATREQRIGPNTLEDDEPNPEEPLEGSVIELDDDDDDERREPELPDLPKLTADQAERYAQQKVVERLRRQVKKADFQATLKRLEKLAGNKARPWGDGGMAVHVDSRSRGGKMLRGTSEGLREALETSLGPGFKAFRNALSPTGSFLVMSREQAVLLPTTDPLDVIAAFGVSAPNVSIGPQDILATLRDFPIRLHHVRHDMVVGFVEPVPTDRAVAQDLALRYLALHPEVIFEDDPVSIVTNRLLQDGRIYFWWD